MVVERRLFAEDTDGCIFLPFTYNMGILQQKENCVTKMGIVDYETASDFVHV